MSESEIVSILPMFGLNLGEGCHCHHGLSKWMKRVRMTSPKSDHRRVAERGFVLGRQNPCKCTIINNDQK